MANKFKVGDFIVVNTHNSRKGQTQEFDTWYVSKQPQEIFKIDEEEPFDVLWVYGLQRQEYQLYADEVLASNGICLKQKRITSWKLESIR